MTNQQITFGELFNTCLTMVKFEDPKLEEVFQYEIAMEKTQNTWKLLKAQGLVK